MKKDFETFYNEIDKEKINEVWNNSRKAIHEKNKKAVIIILIVNIVIIFAYIKFVPSVFNFKHFEFSIITYMYIIVPILIIDLFISIIIGAFNTKEYSAYNSVYKEKIIESLLNNFFDEVNYMPNSEMPESIYMEAKYNEYYEEYISDDYMKAVINNKTQIEMAEIETTKEETVKDSDGNTHTETVTVFSGIFAKINMEKSINNEIKITYNYGVRAKEQLVMDSKEFEKYFDVASKDKILGMRLLTHDVMEILVELRKILNKPFEIYIKENKIYLRLDVGEMFEGRITKKDSIDERILKQYYDVLDCLYKLSTEMIKVIEEIEI